MRRKKLNFQIMPIFNQSIGNTWSEFINIETECDKKLYGLKAPCANVIMNRLRDYECDMREYTHNFAFAAYQGNQIIGFTQGYAVDRDEVYLNRLYVLPQYQNYGIGTKLLRATEQSYSILVNKITLIALSSAVDFYTEKQGYTAFGSTMEKELSPIRNSIVPVFQWIKKDFNLKITCPVETVVLKQSKFQPIFVHVNDDSEIDAVATRTKCGTKKIWDNQSGYCKELLTALNKTK